MAFTKGQSGNPGGRPKKTLPDGRSVSDIAKEHTEEAIAVLVQIMTESESDPARVSAVNTLLDRGWGRSTQMVSGDPNGAPIAMALNVSNLSEAALRELAALDVSENRG